MIDHIDAIRRWSRSDVFVLPIFGDLPDELDLESFDGLVIHYNLVMSNGVYLSPLARWRVSQFSGVKAAFVQDEYRFVDSTVGVMRTLGIDVLFTCVPEDQVELVYPDDALPAMKRKVTVLTGYVPEELLSLPLVPYEDRTVDVGYRGRRLPAWLGSLGAGEGGDRRPIPGRCAVIRPEHRHLHERGRSPVRRRLDQVRRVQQVHAGGRERRQRLRLRRIHRAGDPQPPRDPPGGLVRGAAPPLPGRCGREDPPQPDLAALLRGRRPRHPDGALPRRLLRHPEAGQTLRAAGEGSFEHGRGGPRDTRPVDLGAHHCAGARRGRPGPALLVCGDGRNRR